ncbi:hypothetical protein PN498_24230 [Oscillatoria sp. CS-180]|uniref:hypothetical protein n=1 Tax=Oscillatoria sp. CS-180 TaxID=3021720 RepID=UPI00232D84D9|nr:hypothetical protein [Oscillatoria sp. CS-180]MDB9529123.1 hypothetical protein [Oscillatoria sp. CS-180]
MFHLYFGAFDIALYLGGTYIALVLAKAICEEAPAEYTASVNTLTASSEELSVPASASVRIPQTKSVEQPQRVSLSD